MRFIGITGGVGAGKSAILAHLASKPGIRVMLADEIAHDLMQPGTECFQKLKEKFAGEDIYQPDGSLDRAQLATVIFSDDRKREELNAIVHPAVREYVLQQKEAEERAGKLFLLVLEAALLIEEHYDEICDELWYIYTDEAVRRERLKSSRHYTDEKITRMIASQPVEEVFRKACTVVIDNSGDFEATKRQIGDRLNK
mgnify:CR=1 FL=1